jgi:hypothetical protein
MGEVLPSKGEVIPVKKRDNAPLIMPIGEGTMKVANTIEEVIRVQPRENLKPMKRIVHKSGWRNKWWLRLKRLINWLYLRSPWRPLTAEEKRAAEEMKKRKEMQVLLESEANLFANRIITACIRMELCYRKPKSDRNILVESVEKLRFRNIILQPEALYFQLETSDLPRGTDILKFMDAAVLTDLSIACDHPVTGDYNPNIGAWYILERAGNTRGIPVHVAINDMWEGLGADDDPMTLCIGISRNATPIYASLAKFPHLLIAGTTRAGKSNALNGIICTLIRRNTPKQLRMLMVDLKAGMEFSWYEGIPHLMPIPGAESGVAYTREQVMDILKWIHGYGEKRMMKYKSEGYKDIGRYNQKHRSEPDERIVLIIDEWGDIIMDKKIAKDAEEIKSNICSRMGALGIHVITCTQYPKSEIISTRIKAVLPAKLAFNCATLQGSMAIIGSGNARSLSPQGRAVFQFTDETFLQSPFMPDDLIKDVVKGVKEGKVIEVKRSHDVSQSEIQQWALDTDNGFLTRDRIFNTFRHRGLTKKEIMSWLESWEGKEFVIGTVQYRVEGASGTRPRRLVAVEAQTQTT